jgi:thiol-disulfide isomerase/thioredoxin
MYSQNDSFYLTLTGEMLRIKQTKDSLYNSYLRKPFSKPVNSLIKRQIEVAEKQFTPINPVAEPLFLNSTVLMQWVWSYLFQYKNETLGREEQAKNYMNGIDTLANMFNTVPDVRSNIFIEVGKAFEQSGYDEVSLHIYEVYLLTNTCHADEAIKIKAENLKNIQVGKTAPDILFDNMVTDISSLYKIKAKYTLLVFWVSWCSHCRELIPKLAEFYKEANMAQNNAPAYFQVLAISLDTSKQEWVNYQIAHNLSWYNYSDLKAWKSKVAEAYCVSSTPTMFLLNEDKKIIAKPISVAELLKELKVNK